MQGGNREVMFKAIQKAEMKLKKEMGGEEGMVLSQIQAAGNEGIWTKQLKAKTELHQTVITRCLKSLESKQLIKAVKSVKHPTRKIYMMANLEPSVEITGGPWYTDNELDVEFIRMLSSACLQYIRDRTLPKGSLGAPPEERKLFPHSNPPAYPNAAQVLSFLQKSRITDTELGLEHVEMLLDVLVYDGAIERLPAFGSGFGSFGKEEESDEDEEEEEERKRKKKSKKKKSSQSDDEEQEDSSDGEKRKSKKKRKRGASPSEKEESEVPQPKKKKVKNLNDDESSDSESESESDDDRNNRKKKKKKNQKQKRKHRGSSLVDSDVSSSDIDRPAKKKSKSSKKERETELFTLTELTQGSAVVYRALLNSESQSHTSIGLGWTETPCAKCPQFEFCAGGVGLSEKGAMDLEEGPVNPRNCTYFETWAEQSVAVS